MSNKRSSDLTSGRPPKRARLEESSKPAPERLITQRQPVQTSSTPRFTDVNAIRNALRLSDISQLIQHVNALRNSVAKAANDPDERSKRNILLVEWLGGGGVSDVDTLLETSNREQRSPLLAPVFSLLSELLASFRTVSEHQSVLSPLFNVILSERNTDRLNRCIYSEDASLVLAAMKLWLEMSMIDSLQAKVSSAWNWGGKSGSKLLNMRRRGKGASMVNSLEKPDIRTLYILFLLSFLSPTTPPFLKQYLLSQKDTFTSIFKDLRRDPVDVIRKVLEVCWDGIWQDKRLHRTLKINIFNEWLVGHIVRLYDRAEKEDDSHPYAPADLAHHFLLAICTRPGTGICFTDNGWYPREAGDADEDAESNPDADNEVPNQSRSRIHNKMLANIVKTLRVGEDPRQQELALKTLEACPELVSGYWPVVNLTLEPRLSSRWLANISFFGKVISLSIPVKSFKTPSALPPTVEYRTPRFDYRPNAPPLSVLLGNSFPAVLSRSYLTKGLQSKHGLVQLFTANALARCFDKLEFIRREMRIVEDALGEGDEGQWSDRRNELEEETRRRVPDFSVIVAFSQQKFGNQQAGLSPKATVLKEAAMRLLWCCQRSLPDLVTEARFDCGKLFMGLKGGEIADNPNAHGLEALSYLHAMRLLRANDQFSWSTKAASSSSYTYFYHILMLLIKTDHPTIRSACVDLATHLLSNSVMFEHDMSEPHIWLECLPLTLRDGSVQGPDGHPLTDEAHSVVSFLDDCLHRCLKTPYRYLEELSTMLLSPDNGPLLASQASDLPSPLFMAFLEQLNAKINAGSLSFSDTLAVVSYISKLILGFIGKPLGFTYADRLLSQLSDSSGLSSLQVSGLSAPLRQQVDFVLACIEFIDSPVILEATTRLDISPAFMLSTDDLQIDGDERTRRVAATKLIDSIRVQGYQLGRDGLKTLISTVNQLSSNGTELVELLRYLNPKTMNLWSFMSPEDASSLFSRRRVPAFLLFLHCGTIPALMIDAAPIIIDAAKDLIDDGPRLLSFLRIVLRRLEILLLGNEPQSPQVTLILELLQGILLLPMSSKVRESVVSLVFGSAGLTALLTGVDVPEGAQALVPAGLRVDHEHELALAAPYCHHCIEQLRLSSSHEKIALRNISCWVPYMSSDELLLVVDFIITALKRHTLEAVQVAPLLRIPFGILLAKGDTAALRSLTSMAFTLLDFEQVLHDQNILDVLKHVLWLSLPVGYVGGDSSGHSIAAWISDVDQHWNTVGQQPNDVRTSQLDDEAVSVSGVNLSLIALLSYGFAVCRDKTQSWLNETNNTADLNHAALHPMSILLDIEGLLLDTGPPDMSAHILSISQSTLPIAAETLVQSLADKETLGACTLILQRFSELKEPGPVASAIFQCLPLSSPLAFTRESLSFILWAVTMFPDEFSACAPSYLSGALRWIVRRFSEDPIDSSELLDNLCLLSNLIERTPSIKKHLVDPVLTAIWRSRFLIPEALELACTLCKVTEMESETVVRHLQAVLQHPNLRAACSAFSTKEIVVRILQHLFGKNPHATHQVAHLRYLLTLYTCSMTLSDRTILCIIWRFEKQRSLSSASLLLGDESASPILTLLALDSSRMLKTCLGFPIDRALNDAAIHNPPRIGNEQAIYDPAYVFGIFGIVLSQHVPTGLEWVHIGRTNTVSLVICGLASRDVAMRRVAFTLVTGIWKAIQDVPFLEHDQVVYNLQLLRNLLILDSDGPERLPTFTVLLIAQALHSLFHPAALIYPHVSQFLLQRPLLDPIDVPMLYHLLYSSTDDWKRERLWIVRFVGCGMKSGADWAAMRRRRTWDLLATMFQSEVGDRQLRQAILEVLAALSLHQSATHSLVLRSSLLSWIFTQLLALSPTSSDALPFLRILENVTCTISFSKADRATYGSWRSEVARCMRLALQGSGSGQLERLHIAARTLLRLTAPPEITEETTISLSPAVRLLLDACVSTLKELETTVLADVSVPRRRPVEDKGVIHYTVTSPPAELEGAQKGDVWASCVRFLWRAGMTLKPDSEDGTRGLLDLRSEEEKKRETKQARKWWDELTPRLVGLTGIGDAGGEEARWAKKEVGRMMVLRSLERKE